MKGVPIKFRGRFWLKGLEPSDINTRLNDGDFVFGGYARMKFLLDDDEGDYIIHNDSAAFLVYPDSVAQLVGYDANGEEVYTNDIVVDEQYKDRLFLPRQYADKTVVRVETSSLRSDYSGSAFVPLQTRISHKPPYESINVKVYLYKGELVDDGEVI